LTKEGLEASVEAFARSMSDAACVVYFTGYAFGTAGANFFLPELSAAERMAGVQRIGVPVWGVIQRLLASRARAVFVALDSARPFSDSPGPHSIEEVVEEMSPVEETSQSQKNVVIAYSAAARTWAVNTRARSTFAAAFANVVQRPERRSLQDVARWVRADVLKATNGAQRPWFQSASGVPIYFRDGRDLNETIG
jgi:uncharacterized caspase-like protein